MIYKIPILFYLAVFVSDFFPAKSQTFTIAAAANFREPIEKISVLFMKENPAIKVRTVFGSSGSLYQQIANHAPFDIFFSADMKYPADLYKEGLTTGEPEIYAVGQLVLWSKSNNMDSNLTVLNSADLKKIVIANPDLAPYGKSAMECLQYFRLYEKVKNKLVLAENINQAAQFAITGNCDAGLLALSQMRSAAFQGKGSYIMVPQESYSRIEQGVVSIKSEENAAAVSKFMAFMHSEKVKAIILAYGYHSGDL